MTINEHQVLAQLEPAILGTARPDERYDGRSQDPLSAANFFTCRDPAALLLAGLNEDVTPSLAMKPRWYSDGRVSHIIRAMDDAGRYLTSLSAAADGDGNSAKSATAKLRAEFEAAVTGGPENRGTTIDLLVDGVTHAVAELLFIDVAAVDTTKSVAAHGADSLTAAELRSWFHRALGVYIKMPTLLDAHLGLRDLIEQLADARLGT